MLLKIEAIFGGVLALVVVGVALFFIATTSFDKNQGAAPAIVTQTAAFGVPDSPVAASDLVCQCYDAGRELAGTGVSVMSSQYRFGFEQCRAIAKVAGGDAWTAGWNARLSAKPYEASCRRYKKRGV